MTTVLEILFIAVVTSVFASVCLLLSERAGEDLPDWLEVDWFEGEATRVRGKKVRDGFGLLFWGDWRFAGSGSRVGLYFVA